MYDLGGTCLFLEKREKIWFTESRDSRRKIEECRGSFFPDRIKL